MPRIFKLALCVGLIWNVHTVHAGDVEVNFLGPYVTHFDLTYIPTGVASADIDGDGLQDLIVVDQLGTGASGLAVLVNETSEGALTPTFAAPQFFDKGDSAYFVVAADLNGDGMPDLAMPVGNGVSVMLNTSDLSQISFAPAQIFPAGSAPGAAIAVAVADINSDGRPDLLVTSRDNAISILLNTTQTGDDVASFLDEQVFPAGNGPAYIETTDVNGDGAVDVIVSNLSDSSVNVLMNTTPVGASVVSFAMPMSFPTGALPSGIAIADFNGDGSPDIAVANQQDNTISVLLNDTVPGSLTPVFLDQQTFPAGFNPLDVIAADFAGHGRPDLAVTNLLDGTVAILVNTTGQGSTQATFASPQVYPTDVGAPSIVATDVNQDGKPDFVFVNLSTANVYVNATGIVAAPTLSEMFAPADVEPGDTSTLTLIVGNANATDATLTADLLDTLPIGLVIATAPNATTTCSGGTVNATAGSGSFALSSGAAIPNGSCTVAIDIAAATVGTYVNTIAADALQTDAGFNTSPASATLTVAVPLDTPTLSKTFVPESVPSGTPSTVTLTLANTNATAATLTSDLDDTLPDGLIVAPTPNATTTCPAGTVTASVGAGFFTLSSGAEIPSGSCTVSVDVESANTGSYINTIAIGALQTDAGGNAEPATATLNVTPPVITDRIFCDGFDGHACEMSGIVGLSSIGGRPAIR